MYRIFYRSSQTAATAADVDFVVRQIIQTSIRNNRGSRLSGLLLSVQGHFVQALEGPVDEVRATYARISQDQRHQDLRIIAEGPAEQRLFGDWNMCARALAPSDAEIVDVIDFKGVFKPTTLNAQSVRRLLTTVADVQRRSALTALVR